MNVRVAAVFALLVCVTGCRSWREPGVTVSCYSVTITGFWPQCSVDVLQEINDDAKPISDYVLGSYETYGFRVIVTPQGSAYSFYISNEISRGRVSDEKLKLIADIISMRIDDLAAAEARGEKIGHIGVATIDAFFARCPLTRAIPDRRSKGASEGRQPNQALQTTPMTRSVFEKAPVSDRQRRGV